MSGPHSAAQQRIEANVEPVPPDQPPVRCRCDALYLDFPLGRDAHEVVFAHQPAPAAEPVRERHAGN